MALTKQETEQLLTKWKSKKSTYDRSLRQGNDDAIFGNMGFYTARQEKAYINKQIKYLTQILKTWPPEADNFEWGFYGSWTFHGPDGFKVTRCYIPGK